MDDELQKCRACKNQQKFVIYALYNMVTPNGKTEGVIQESSINYIMQSGTMLNDH